MSGRAFLDPALLRCVKIVFVDGAGSRDLDVVVDVATATVADLAAALDSSRCGAGGDAGLIVDGLYAAGDLAVGEAGIHEGAVVCSPGDGASIKVVQPATVDMCIIGGFDAGRRVPLEVGGHVVGRSPGCHVVFSDMTVSRRHCQLDVNAAAQVTLTNLSDSTGTFVDGREIDEPTKLPPGAAVEIGSVLVAIRPPPGDDRPAGVDRFRNVTGSGTINLNRPPRFAPPGTPDPIDPPDEPSQLHQAPFNIASLALPAIGGVVMAIALRNPLYATFAVLSPAMMLANWWESKHRSKRALRSESRKYQTKVAEFGRILGLSAQLEIDRRRAALPDLAEVVRRATAPSIRLWERRLSDPDFLRLSAGVGDGEWHPGLVTHHRPLGDDITGALDRCRRLAMVPVEVDLSNGGVVGIVGDRTSAVAVARSLICQAAVHHGPADLRLVLAAHNSEPQVWDWMKWLPHTRDPRPSATERRLLAAGATETAALLDGLAARHDPVAPSDQEVTLFVVDGDELLSGPNSTARALLRGVAGPAAGIVLASSPDRLPAICTSILTIGNLADATISEPRIGLARRDFFASGLSPATARTCALALARFEDPEVKNPGAALPGMLALPALLHMTTIDAQSVASSWRDHAGAGDLRAPIGASESGDFWLDMDRHGPHGLIGGTTGSGKSELLKTLVAAFAATYSPDEVTFGLFDFKGGSTFTEFVSLPHAVGMANDLDVHLARRALECLRAELLYRERLFDIAGVKDLNDYRKSLSRTATSAMAGPPVPRLIVIIDEFAAMASELAEEIGALTDLTARGRSLGVHLILATQKPSTSVNSDIRTNTRLRISLQVEDKQDSLDVVGIPDAASIRQKGRGYFRVGQSEIIPLQTALSSGASPEARRAAVEVAPFVFGIDPRPPVITVSNPPNERLVPSSDLQRLVGAIGEAFAQSGQPAPRRPWPDPLPRELALQDLARSGDSGPSLDDPTAVYFCLADDPAAQTRYPAGWSLAGGNLLVFGVVGSGVTTTLASIALAFCGQRTADQGHLYALDFGSGALAGLEGLPHCGAYVTATDRERQIRLIRVLRAEIDRRRNLGPGATTQLPTILLVLDNIEGFRSDFEDAYGLGIIEQATRIYSDGPGVGIFMAAGASRLGGVPAVVSSATSQKLVLRLSDPSDYGAFGISRKHIPTFVPGRGLLAATGHVVQVGQPFPDLARAVAALANAAAPATAAPMRIGRLPRAIGLDRVAGTAEVSADTWRLPIGLADRDLEAATLVLYEHEHAVIAGPARCGKSTTLLTMAAALRRAVPGAAVLGVACRRSPLRGHPLLDMVCSSVDDLPGVLDAALVVAGPTLLLLDDAEALDDPGGRIARMLSQRRPDLHLAIAGRADVLRGLYGHWTQVIRRSKAGLLLQPTLEIDGELLGARLPTRVHLEIPPGRGFLVCDGHTELVQAAQPAS